jgi:hypothetical protein
LKLVNILFDLFKCRSTGVREPKITTPEKRISFILAEVQTALEATRKASSHENTN